MENINTQIIIGLILLVMGLIIFLGNLDLISGDFTLFIIGGGFFLAYFFSGKNSKQRKIGLLITATIILMIALFDIIDNYISPELSASVFFALLATSFLLIYLIHTFHYKQGSKWPIYVSIIIYIFSLFIYLIEVIDLYLLEEIAEKYWPVIFVVIGIVLLFKGISANKSETKE